MALASLALLAACSSTDKPKPAELTPLTNSLPVKQSWTYSISKGTPDFDIAVVGGELVVASQAGQITRLETATGRTLADYRHNHAISAAVAADADTAAFVDVQNELVMLKRDGAVAWRQRLPSQVLATPLLAKGAVFVLGMDQSVRAFDMASGSVLWASTRTPPSLVLSRSGGLAVEGETLFAALAQGKMVALSTSSGVVRWEQTVATSRGSNEVEKLTDLIGKPILQGGDVCARSYQVGATCVALQSGRNKWTRNVTGSEPMALDSQLMVISDKASVMSAHKRDSGDNLWTTDKLKFREMAAPALTPRAVVAGDELGMVHWLSRDSGAALARMSADNTAINTAPVQAGNVLIVRTQSALYAYTDQ